MQRAREIIGGYSDRRIALGVSGGADSMCLLYLAMSALDKKNLTVINVDHRLRRTSARDSALVEEFCRVNGVKFEPYSADIASLAREHGNSIETEARLFRRRVFSEFCARNNAVLMLAHNADDRAETVLMHIFRGCGLSGLVGMREEGGEPFTVRPLLGYSKAEIYDFVKANGIPYCEDETNADSAYRRNFIRNEVLPLIESRYPSVKQRICSLSDIAAEISSGIVGEIPLEIGDAVKIPTAAVQGELAYYGIDRAIKAAGVCADIERKHYEAVKKLAASRTGARIELPHGLCAAREGESIAFYYPRKKITSVSPFAEGRTVFEAEYVGESRRASAIVAEIKYAEKPFDLSAAARGVLTADADKIPSDAVIRFRREGDRFRPFGGGDKKLKDYLTDKKIPARQKDFIPLVCVGDRVLAVLGIEIGEEVKVSETTTKAAVMRVLTGGEYES